MNMIVNAKRASAHPVDWSILERNGILSTNYKLDKSIGKVIVAGVTLAPHSLAGVGNVCPQATEACRNACVLWFAGRTVTKGVRQAAINRTRAFFEDRKRFMAILLCDLAKLERKGDRQGLPVCVRLNVASDLAWEGFARNIIEAFPSITFYDYTKVVTRAIAYTQGKLPVNYHLTFSYSEKATGLDIVSILEAGGNVAMVFSTKYVPSWKIIGKLPSTFAGYVIVDGDVSDIRTPSTDGKGVIVGLRFKGGNRLKEQAIKDGFCIAVPEEDDGEGDYPLEMDGGWND